MVRQTVNDRAITNYYQFRKIPTALVAAYDYGLTNLIFKKIRIKEIYTRIYESGEGGKSIF